MSLFVSMTGVFGGKSNAVLSALGIGFEERSVAAFDDTMDTLVLPLGQHVTVLHPNFYEAGEQTAQELSKALSCATIDLYIHEGALWMYTLFDRGAKLDQFSTVPDYPDLYNEPPTAWKGDARVLSHIANVPISTVEPLLKRWSEASDGKAHDDDGFHYGNPWQLLDLARRLGFSYPISGVGTLVEGTVVARVRHR